MYLYVTNRIRYITSPHLTSPRLAFQITNLIGYLCSAFSTYNYYSHSEWFCFVSMSGFWFTGILLLLYVLHVIEKFQRVPWLKLVSRDVRVCVCVCVFS